MFDIVSVCKGGGYMYARTNPIHPKANAKKLYPLHRVLVENSIGRILDKKEIVHHKDGDKFNNSIENLEVVNWAEHSKLHAKTVKKIICKCSLCFSSFELQPNLFRLRKKRSLSSRLYCSRKCVYKSQEKSN